MDATTRQRCTNNTAKHRLDLSTTAFRQTLPLVTDTRSQVRCAEVLCDAEYSIVQVPPSYHID